MIPLPPPTLPLSLYFALPSPYFSLPNSSLPLHLLLPPSRPTPPPTGAAQPVRGARGAWEVRGGKDVFGARAGDGAGRNLRQKTFADRRNENR